VKTERVGKGQASCAHQLETASWFVEARPASVTGPARCWGLGIRAGSPTSTPSGTTRVDRASGSAPERVHRARRSLSTRLANAIDLPDLRLGDEPLARANHLPFGGHVVAPGHTVRQGPASSAHGHPPVRFRLMVVVELAARLRCACRRHAAPISRHSGLGMAAPRKEPSRTLAGPDVPSLHPMPF